MLLAERYHDISCGHRVFGHEGKCRNLHGHNYRVFFVCEAPEVDAVGRVIDFSVMKERLCEWLEKNWDHRFLVWGRDPMSGALGMMDESVVKLPFNPTAENIARYLVTDIGPRALDGTGVRLIEVRIEETRKCSATYRL